MKKSPKKKEKNQKSQNVYQFKIVLERTRPPIWRRILVPEEYTFWDLHTAIQNAMGWTDSHLHHFATITSRGERLGGEKYIGIPDPEGWTKDLPGWEVKIKDWFPELKKMRYEYDFGDGWEHLVTLEKILPKDFKTKYPVCVAGKMACPPEDCGGAGGYYDLLEIIKDKKHAEHKGMVEWLGDEEFDPEEFDPSTVEFENPKKRLKFAKEMMM